jgi:quercetin dioxygenase-like cupin family protein
MRGICGPAASKLEGVLVKQVSGSIIGTLLCLSISGALNIGRIETKDVQPVQRFEQVISGHLTDLNGKYKFRVSEVTYQPGGYVGDHHHAGPGVRVIMAGEFTYVKGDKTTVYKAGDAFFEPGDVTHRAYNRGSTILKVMNIEILPSDFTGSALIPPPQ